MRACLALTFDLRDLSDALLASQGEITDDELRTHFSAYGEITDAVVSDLQAPRSLLELLTHTHTFTTHAPTPSESTLVALVAA